MNKTRTLLLPVFGLIIIGALLRVLRHYGWIDLPPNVAPVSVIAFLAAAYLPRRWGVFAPLGLMAASDIAIGGYNWRIMAVVYVSFGISYLLGTILRHRRSVMRLSAVTLAGATSFFLLTNAADWLWSGTYARTLGELGRAYQAGLPFFRNMLIGDLAYVGIGFGIVEGCVLYWRRHQAQAEMTSHG